MAFVGIALWHRVQARQRWLPLEGRALALVWFLPFIMFLFGRNKDIRFTAPLLPAVAVTLAWMVDSVLSSLKTWGRLAFGLLLLLPLAAYLQTSFGLLGNTRLALESIVLMAPRLSHAGPPDRQPWPHQEILEVLRSFSEFAAKRTVMLGSDTPHFNANNFELAAADGQYPFEISTSAYENDLPALLNATNSKMFILYKESGEQGPEFTNQLLKPLLEDVRTSGKFVDLSRYLEKTKLPELPDGSKVIIYKNEFPNSPIVETRLYRDGNDSGELELPAINVNFANVIRLTGLAFGIENEWLKVIYRWHCSEKLDEDSLCFTHVLDEKRVIGFLDHVILADPDLTRQKGWSASESLRYRLPEGVHEVHLRLGLFRKSSGERLTIQEYSADSITLSLTDQGTAVVASGMAPSLPRFPRSQLE